MLLELSPKINDFFIILFSILIEGIPFILFGAFLSALVEIYFSEERVQKILPKNRFMRFSSMVMMGNIIPVCECGNVPFARRLISKGIKPYFVLTFLLAAPVFNPIVIASTIAAFPNNYEIVFFRLLFTFIIAVSLGYIFMLFSSRDMLIDKLIEQRRQKIKEKNHKRHKHGFFSIIHKEFIEMTAIFLFGATIASIIQIVVPKELIFQFTQNEWIAILAMILLAFVVSICSNVDAFFALAYSQIFPTSAILAFLVFGPMIDIKAIPMFKTIFKWKPLLIIIALIALLTFFLSYLYFLFT